MAAGASRYHCIVARPSTGWVSGAGSLTYLEHRPYPALGVVVAFLPAAAGDADGRRRRHHLNGLVVVLDRPRRRRVLQIGLGRVGVGPIPWTAQRLSGSDIAAELFLGVAACVMSLDPVSAL